MTTAWGCRTGMGLSYRRASLCSLAGRYNNPMPELTLSVRDYDLATGVHFISTPQPGWAWICKCLRSPGIDSKESIPPSYVCWRHRFLDNYKFGLWAHITIMTEQTRGRGLAHSSCWYYLWESVVAVSRRPVSLSVSKKKGGMYSMTSSPASRLPPRITELPEQHRECGKGSMMLNRQHYSIVHVIHNAIQTENDARTLVPKKL